MNFTTIRDREATATEAEGTGRWLTFHEHWVEAESEAEAYGANRAISFDVITVMPQETVALDWEIPASPSGESDYMVFRRVGATVEEAMSRCGASTVTRRWCSSRTRSTSTMSGPGAPAV